MEKETLKSLRAKAKELRSKVSSAPLSKATPDQLRSEILMLERAVKAEEKALAKKALKEEEQKKKSTPSRLSATSLNQPSVKVVPPKEKVIAPKMTLEAYDPKQRLGKMPLEAYDREKDLIKREKELAKKEKMMLSYKSPAPTTSYHPGTESDSDDY
jgi:hypothetical protein